MVYSVNSYSTLSKSKAAFGLASGLNTEELITQMTSVTRSKIATQLQKKQLTLWKQNAYREISSKMTALNKKYFSSTDTNSIINSNFYNVSTINNDSSYIKISGDSTIAQNMVIRDIDSLASKTSFTSSVSSDITITTGEIEAEWQLNYLPGAEFSVNYGGADYKLTISEDFSFPPTDDTDEKKLDAVLNELNTQITADSGLSGKLSFSKISDGNGGYIVQLTDLSGNNEEIKINTDGSAILTNGLGMTAGQTSLAGVLSGTSPAAVSDFYENKILSDVLSGATVTVNLNGVSKNIVFDADEKTQYQDADSLKTYLQSALDDLYGTDMVAVNLDINNGLIFTANDNTSIFTINSASKSTILGENGALHVKAGESNRLEMTKTLQNVSSELTTPFTANAGGKYEMTVNGTKFEFAADTMLGDVISTINNSGAGVKISYISTTNAFTVSASDYGTGGAVDLADSGGSNLATALFGSGYTITQGQDAKIEISFDGGSNYQWVTRNSNSFTLDGVSIQLLGKADGAEQENISFSVSTDADALYKKLSDFISDYNDIINLITSKITEKQSTDETYLPLTDEQKKEMTDDEIKNWETEAKKGLLRNDKYLNDILTDMRSAMTSVVTGVDTTLSKIGIGNASYSWQENGILHIDENSLKAAITSDANAIKNLFLQQPVDEDDTEATGLAFRLQSVFKKNINTLGTDGILIALAGAQNDNSDSFNTLTDQVKNIDKVLDKLKDQLGTEESRYIKQFSALESYISQMNSQSSWLTSMLNPSNS